MTSETVVSGGKRLCVDGVCCKSTASDAGSRDVGTLYRLGAWAQQHGNATGDCRRHASQEWQRTWPLLGHPVFPCNCYIPIFI